jgi:hypothetical protein
VGVDPLSNASAGLKKALEVDTLVHESAWRKSESQSRLKEKCHENFIALPGNRIHPSLNRRARPGGSTDRSTD